jgi:HD superfamily phosphodiesterase
MMNIFTDKRQRKLFEDVRRFYGRHNFDVDHDINHIIRVMWWVSTLSRKEKFDMSVVMPSAILHDLGMVTGKKKNHAQRSAEMCGRFLKSCGYGGKEISVISNTIRMHSAGWSRAHAWERNAETNALYDADKLDAVNPISLQRWISFFVLKGYSHHMAVRKIFAEIDDWKKTDGKIPFYTKTGRKIGSAGLRYIERVLGDIANDYKKFDGIYKELGMK